MIHDVIIIGAGAAGLAAMKELTSQGYSVCLVEAAPVPGGRISTKTESGFDGPFETGAEFIHGKLPYTIHILKEAKIPYEAVEGRMIAVQHGEWLQEEQDEDWPEFMKKLNKCKTDTSIQAFLNENFSAPEYSSLRRAVINFSEGFDLADISKASVLSLKDEWNDVQKIQYRVKGGYIQLINYLVNSCDHTRVDMHFNTCINKIEYNNGNAKLYATDNRQFQASFVILTISAGLLQSGSIDFKPALTLHDGAIKALGFGTVIKFLCWFRTKHWKKFGNDVGFIISDEEIPTWWTQLPVENNLLTGWIGGPRAAKKSAETEESLLLSALQSLSSIFHVPVEMLQQDLVHSRIYCWHNQPYIKGGYSYTTINSKKAKKILSKPVDDIIFFAGEAMASGESCGTVETALQSGYEVARILADEYLSKKTVYPGQ